MTISNVAISRRSFLAAAGTFLIAPKAALAAQRQYRLNASASRVGFRFFLGGTQQKGTMPITKAKITIDPDRLAKSHVDVTVSVKKAQTGLVLATEALKSAEVLDAARYPTIRFVSTSVKLGKDGRLSDGATLRGNLTVRGVTKPVTFQATVYRAAGSAADDLDKLTVRLSGEISRKAFGASGYADLVDDRITLDIQAAIEAA